MLKFLIPAIIIAISFAALEKVRANDSSRRPNIIIIMADDMGFSDIGCYGGEIQTPNIDRLAGNGLRFTQFYNTARCCPTRASLLTGVYPHQADIGRMVHDSGVPGYRGRLNPKTATPAELLGHEKNGYQTFIVGKWHVTPYDYKSRVASDRGSWPLQRGFDHFYGTLAGGGSYFDPVALMRDNEFIKPPRQGYYYTDVISDAAAGFIGDAAGDPRPFFMYIAYTSPHWPLHAKEKDIAKYQGVYDKGWDALRAERLARMKRLGIVDDRHSLSDRDPRVPAWKDVKDKRWQARRMAVYAAQIDAMDQGIGRIVAALEKTGRLDNTLIMFLADNGGCDELLGENDPNRINYYAYPLGDDFLCGNNPQVDPGPRNTFASYGIGWANASNTPFRLYKKRIQEGGVSTPLVVHWPRVIKCGGELRHQVGHVVDLVPTCLDAAGIEYPGFCDKTQLVPPEGQSLLPAMKGQTVTERTIYWEHIGNQGVRRGDWKLVRERGKPWSLYNLAKDPVELEDLTKKNVSKVKELVEAYNAWAKRCNVNTLKPDKTKRKRKR
ncbi:MAG: arylsulfatase [Pirellulales bacterium]|nr:arylsulfatase [Pirellulales bacterium]